MKQFLDEAAEQNHPLRILSEFLKKEKALDLAKEHDKRRFVGYVLNIGYGEITIITCDPFKVAVGGIPRNSLLLMVPSTFDSNGNRFSTHFTLLRVLDSAPTPLTSEVQQTYFELQKKSMPELDVFTQSELQWGALRTGVLGMFYQHPENSNTIEFSGDLNNYLSAHKYLIYSPSEELLDLVNNSLVPNENRFRIGKLRLTECRLPLPNRSLPNVNIYLSTLDFMGTRTAMFGKTRLGKSNVVKLIAQSLIETTIRSKNVGQLIFDINGEYANDNPQDDNYSLKSSFPKRCIVYALTKKSNTESKELKLDFYANPTASHRIIRTLLEEDGRNSIYIKSFLSVDIPNLEKINLIDDYGEKKRAQRKLLIYWAILKKAGFPEDLSKLKSLLNIGDKFNNKSMESVFGENKDKWLKPNTLEELVQFYEFAIRKDRENKLPSSTSGKNLFDADDEGLLNFLFPVSSTSAGPKLIQSIRKYHSKYASDFVKEIIEALGDGKTVIIDLGNADEEIMQYFSRELSNAVFKSQTLKFTENRLADNYIQIYFEEAHNLFGYNDSSESTKIYRRFAKEGAKYHIGMVYSTQSPTTINPDLLAQTENFFIAHLASVDDVNKLAKLNVAYESMKNDILMAKTPGYIRMLTRSHRFVVSMQAMKYNPKRKEVKDAI